DYATYNYADKSGLTVTDSKVCEIYQGRLRGLRYFHSDTGGPVVRQCSIGCCTMRTSYRSAARAIDSRTSARPARPRREPPRRHNLRAQGVTVQSALKSSVPISALQPNCTANCSAEPHSGHPF